MMGHPAWSERYDNSFVAIDFETATSARESACAVAAVMFNKGTVVDSFVSLIQPPGNEYDPFNISIHGIKPSDTQSSPTFPEVRRDIEAFTEGALVVAHNTSFDMSVLRRSSEHYGYQPGGFAFACTYRLFRSHMPEMGMWRLDVLADEFDIPLTHHDPMSDAEAAGRLWLALPGSAALSHKRLLDFHDYRLGQFDVIDYLPFSNARSSSANQPEWHQYAAASAIDPSGRLYGRNVALTGKLASMKREDAFDAIRRVGSIPVKRPSRATDYLVVGSINLAVVGPGGMSGQHKKAYELQQAGHPIQIIDEDDFHCLLANEPI